MFYRLALGILQVDWIWRRTRRERQPMCLTRYPIDLWLSPPYWYVLFSIYTFSSWAADEATAVYIFFLWFEANWRFSLHLELGLKFNVYLIHLSFKWLWAASLDVNPLLGLRLHHDWHKLFFTYLFKQFLWVIMSPNHFLVDYIFG